MSDELGLDENRKWLRLYTILADTDTMHELKYAIEENDAYLDKHGLTLHYLFKPMKAEFAYYKETDMESNGKAMTKDQVKKNAEEGFNEHNPKFVNATKGIKKEGVYYLSYIYEKMNSTKLEDEENLAKNNTDYEHQDKNLKYISYTTVTIPLERRRLRIHDGTLSKESLNAGARAIKTHQEEIFNKPRSY